jgi:hypothetical protein
MTTSPKAETIVIPINEAERQQALVFAQEQPNREKARQVYLNTLAVQAVKWCLDVLEIPTDVADSESWNPFSRLAADVADLQIPGVGALECRPIRGEVQECSIPPEVLENRIGYVVVQIDQSCQEATLLGFVPAKSLDSLSSEVRVSLEQLYPMQDLFMYLEEMAAGHLSSEVLQKRNHLSQWLNPVVDTLDGAWQRVEALLGSHQQPAFAFRGWRGGDLDTPEKIQHLVEQLYTTHQFGRTPTDALPFSPDSDLKAALAYLIQTTTEEETRWKAAEVLWTLEPGHPAAGVRRILDLGLLLAEQPVVLMVAVMQIEDNFSVLARVYPTGVREASLQENRSCLPIGLQLAVLPQDGSPEIATQARERDNYIQLKLTGELGETFGIRVSLNQDSVTEYFVI